MSPEVLARKLARLRGFLEALGRFRGSTPADLEADPYAVERLLELVVQVSVDLVSHELSKVGVVAESYRDAFRKAGRHGILPEDLASRLEEAAGLRNLLVHMYEQIDYRVVAESIGPALEDFGAVLELFERRLAALEE